MGMQEMRLIRDLQQEVTRLKQRLEQRPISVSPISRANFYTVTVDQGNTLETGQTGIRVYDGTLENIPSAYDPDVTTSYTNGMGRGTLYKNGVQQDGYVLIVNDDRGSFQNALLQGDVIYAGGPVSVSVSGGGYVKAWTAG